MNKATLLFLGIGAAIFFAGKKLLGASTTAKPAPSPTGTLGQLGNAALAAIPPQYGFKDPAASVLGGNHTATVPGIGATIDLTKFFKSVGELFKADPSKNPDNGKHSTDEDYAAVLAAGVHARDQQDARAALVSAGFPETGADTIGPNGQVFTDLGGFYSPVTLDPLEGSPGQNFSLENGPLNSTDGNPQDLNPFLFDAPGGADFGSFSQAQDAAA